ncbi:hypothetical protein CORC01_11823 [Colletotrichum orchidophilum]|uniref:Uncharacterized protein n=1 Tax=Colletotrichum orchidophilum TaxID=1209926 RepID=A0A1G4AUU4_9PEZI|nr:uncharacterized protein CORC01_11823 [Colletotrichum orchidophilum]OHE92881.1 hypothetical protein CORC01_11823 [Colletotrichum orchidophilum]
MASSHATPSNLAPASTSAFNRLYRFAQLSREAMSLSLEQRGIPCSDFTHVIEAQS